MAMVTSCNPVVIRNLRLVGKSECLHRTGNPIQGDRAVEASRLAVEQEPTRSPVFDYQFADR